MIAFEINDMTCGHCVSTVTKAVKAADKQAKVEVDLSRHLVRIDPAGADAQELIDAIKGRRIHAGADRGFWPLMFIKGWVLASLHAW